MRYREMAKVDLSAARKLVADWLDEHTDGTLEQMAADLKGHYKPEHQEDMAVVMRGMMAAELRRRTSPPPEIPPGPAAPGATRSRP